MAGGVRVLTLLEPVSSVDLGEGKLGNILYPIDRWNALLSFHHSAYVVALLMLHQRLQRARTSVSQRAESTRPWNDVPQA